MLHWLAGQKAPEGSSDPDTTGYIEPPDTPAPVFAVRAFKHAIFGTPQPTQKPRRHSNSDNTRPSDARPVRPGMTRPKSSGDAQLILKRDDVDLPELPPSPTKGILMTPGTVAARRKTVSFGENVVDNEGKRASKSGLPDAYPCKYPSPWITSSPERNSGDNPAIRARGRSGKLMEALEQVRDDSAHRKLHQPNGRSHPLDVDTTVPNEPVTEEGRFWKATYDLYRENTTHEVRKLVMRKQSARKHAEEKNAQCSELMDQLKQETNKVVDLEKRMAGLEEQIKSLEDQLRRSRSEQAHAEKASLEKHEWAGTRDAKVESMEGNQAVTGQTLEKAARPMPRRGISDLLRERKQPRSMTVDQALPVTQADSMSKPIPTQESRLKRTHYRPRSIETKPQNDLWTQASSSQLDADGPPPPRVSRQVTSGTDNTPLQSLSINTTSYDSHVLAMSMGMQPPSPQRSKPRDSPMQSPDLPLPSPDPVAETPLQPFVSGSALTLSNLDSSPFQLHAPAERPAYHSRNNNNVVVTSSSAQTTPGAVQAAFRAATKENVAPMDPLTSNTTSAAAAKSSRLVLMGANEGKRGGGGGGGGGGESHHHTPSSAWTALNAPPPHTVRRMVSKSGEEVDHDRYAAARARILARGRQVS